MSNPEEIITEESIICLTKEPMFDGGTLRRDLVRMMISKCKPTPQIKDFDIFLTKCMVLDEEDRIYLMAFLSIIWYVTTSSFDFSIPMTQENLIAICATTIFKSEALRYALLAGALEKNQITPPLKDINTLINKCNIKDSKNRSQLLLRHVLFTCKKRWYEESKTSTTKTLEPLSLDEDIEPKVYRYHVEVEGRPDIDIEYTDAEFDGHWLYIDNLPTGERVMFNKNGTYTVLS